MLLLKQRVNVVQVPRRLQRRVPQAQKRLPGLEVLSLLHVPAGGLGAEVGAEDEGHRGNEC